MSTAAAFTGTIPEHYDRLLGPAWFDPYAKDLASRLPPDPGAVLEIACGTGLVTKWLRQRLDPGVRLVAIDLNEPMLAYAKRTHPSLDVEWRVADALALPFEAGTFGAVACGFGVMFFPDRAAAMREMHRVLVPGGRLVFSVWDSIEANPTALAAAEVIEAYDPADPALRFRTPFTMHDRGTLLSLLEAGGFAPLRIEPKAVQITGKAQDIALGQIRGTPRMHVLQKRGVPLDEAIAKIAARLSSLGGEDPYRNEARAIVVEATARQ